MLPTATSRTMLYLNGYDTSALGLVVQSVQAWEDAPAVTDAVETLDGRAGEVLTGGYAQVAGLALEVDAVMMASSLTALKANLDALKLLCRRSMLEVRTIDRTDRVLRCRATVVRHPPVSPQFVNPYVKVALTFRAYDPIRYGAEGTSVSFGSLPVAVPLGTWPATPRVLLFGAATNPRLSYYGMTGDEAEFMAFTVTLAGTDYLELDFDAQTIWHVVSGTRSNGNPLLTSGWWFSVDPADAPSVAVSVGTGLMEYRRAYA